MQQIPKKVSEKFSGGTFGRNKNKLLSGLNKSKEVFP